MPLHSTKCQPTVPYTYFTNVVYSNYSYSAFMCCKCMLWLDLHSQSGYRNDPLRIPIPQSPFSYPETPIPCQCLSVLADGSPVSCWLFWFWCWLSPSDEAFLTSSAVSLAMTPSNCDHRASTDENSFPTATTASSDRFSLLMLARTCSKLCCICRTLVYQSFFPILFLLSPRGKRTIAISPISASRCCSKYVFPCCSRVPIADTERCGFVAMAFV